MIKSAEEEDLEIKNLVKQIVKLWAHNHIEEAYTLGFEIFRMGYQTGRRYGDIDLQ